jgi:hypothetical protein
LSDRVDHHRIKGGCGKIAQPIGGSALEFYLGEAARRDFGAEPIERRLREVDAEIRGTLGGNPKSEHAGATANLQQTPGRQ